MPYMPYTEVLQRRDIWESNGNHLMSREEVARFDDFIADNDEFSQYKSNGLRRALVGDFSEFETVEPMMKGYLGAKKCYDLFDRYHGNASDPALQQELKERLMEADLRTGFAFGGKNPNDHFSAFLRECERIANREMLKQTLEEPDATAKLRLMDQFKQENPDTARQKFDTALNQDLEQRVQIAKTLFMNHLGKFQTLNRENQPMEMNENMSEIYTHGGRTMFILPAGNNQGRVMNSVHGQHPDLSGLKSRDFATHSMKARTLKSDGSIASEAKEVKLPKVRAYSPSHHRGMNASVGGLGQVGPNGKVITSDGTNGHMYMHVMEGNKNTCGMLLVGFENSGPQQKGRLGHTHDASAKKAGSSAFLSDKSYVGKETGGRVVDLSGMSTDQLSSLLNEFENAYRNAANAAHNGSPEILNACNELLTGKVMSIGQLKGMLQGMDVPQDQINSVEAARAGREQPISASENPPIPLKFEAKAPQKPFRVTQCEGLVRPMPPAVMKKPGLIDKALHYLSFGSKNSYVNRYKEYQRTLPDRIEEYRRNMEDYNTTLTALENNENPRGLQEAYNRAVTQAKATLGIPVNENVAPQNKPLTSDQMKAQLENTLLNMMMQKTLPEGASQEARDAFREQFSEEIRNTRSYNRLVNSGDANISKVLNNLLMADQVLTNVYNDILENNNMAQPNNSSPERSNIREMSQPENNSPNIGSFMM